MQFDYDNVTINREVYGTDKPPPYDLSKVTASVNLIYSNGDATATAENAEKIKNILPNVKWTYVVPDDNFAHIDFSYSRFLRERLNDKVIERINAANKLCINSKCLDVQRKN